MADRDDQSTYRTPQSSEFESWLKDVARLPVALEGEPIATGDSLVDGRFEVRALLGRGGMGAVFEAWDHRDNHAVALKTLRGRRPEMLYHLKREFRAIADVRHQNLVRLWELHADGERWFFTMELVRGTTLGAALRGREVSEIRRVIGELAAGLAALHRAHLVHRDVKPSNAMVLADGRPVLLDFGIVADLGAGAVRGEVIGTRAYMAPEQAAGEPPTAAADLYSLGAVLFELLTSRLVDGPDDSGLDSIADAELAALCRALLGPAASRPSAADVARALGADTGGLAASGERTSIVVGRERELAQLMQLAAAVSAGGRNAVAVIGAEPGLGKSAVLRTFANAAQAGGHTVFAGRCREREQVPFNAIDSIVDGLIERLRDARRAGDLSLADDDQPELDLRPLARLFPALSALTRGAAPEAAAIALERQRAFGRLADVLALLAGDAPLCLCIDDAHWADNDSMTLLASLLSSPLLSIVVVLTTASGTEHASVLAERAGAELLEINLKPLPLESATRLAQSLGCDDDRAIAIARESDGVPRFILDLAGGVDGLGGSFETYLEGRLAALDAAEARALELVSTATTVFTRQMLIRALADDLADTAVALDSLERGQWVRSLSRRGRSSLEPYHGRIRTAALARLSAGDARDMHRRVATALTDERPDDVIALTYHWRGAGETERARTLALTAARAARQALAFDRAAELLATAIELGADADTALLTERAEALEAAGRGSDAARLYREAAASCPPSDPFALELERRAAEQLLRSGHTDEGLDGISRLLAAQGMAPPKTALGVAFELVVERIRLRRQRKTAATTTGNADDTGNLAATWALAIGLSQVDPLRGALYQTRHLRLALKNGDPTRVALGLCADAMSSAGKGPPARRAHRLLEEAKSVGADSADPRVPAYLTLAHAHIKFLCGDFSLARESAREATALFEACPGARWEQSTANRFYLTCLWHTGRLAPLCSKTAEVAAEARALGDRYGLTQLQTTVLPPVRLLADRPAEARADLDEAWQSLSKRQMFLQHWQHLQATALVDLYDGDPQRAFHAFEERFVGPARFLLSRVKAVRVFTSYVRGLAAVGALAKRPRDRDYARSAASDIAQLEKEGSGAATGVLIEAQLDYVVGRRDAAIRRLRKGIAIAADMDLPLIAACAKLCLSEVTGDARPKVAAADYFAEQPVAQPERIAAMLMPAFAAVIAP